MENNSIIVSLVGRLGNQMFQIANGYTLSKKFNAPLYISTDIIPDCDWVYNFEIFNRFNLIHDSKYFNGIKYVYIEDGKQEYVDMYQLLKNHVNEKIFIRGLFQNETYFYDYRDDIKNLFSCPEEIKNEIIKEYGDLSDYVSINVRRGDYVDIGAVLPDYYHEKAYNKYFSGKKSIIISDDIEWCKKNVKIDGAIYFDKFKGRPNSSLFDLYAGSFCKDHILSNSTFSWWQSYLGEYEDSKIVTPYKWYEVCESWKKVKAEIIPDRWIRFNYDE